MTRASGATELFGKRVRETRRKHKLTQGVVAESIGCSQSHLSTIEWGERVPNLLMIIRLAMALDCKVSELTRMFDNVDLATMLPRSASIRDCRGNVANPHDPDLASAVFKGAPYEYRGLLRKCAPVYRVKLSNGTPAWLISRYEDAVTVLASAEFAKDPLTCLAIASCSRRSFSSSSRSRWHYSRLSVSPSFSSVQSWRLGSRRSSPTCASRRSVRPHASAGGATRFASSMRVRSARNRVWLGAVVTAFAVLAFVVPVLTYDEMPLRVPIHWDATGQVDGWVERNIFVVLFIPALGAYMQFFLYVLRRDFAGAKMTLPADSTEDYLAAKEKYLQTNIDTLDWTRLMIAVTFCGIALLQTSTAVERLRAMEPISRASVFAGLAAMLGGITFFIVRMIRINARLQQQTGNDYAQRSGAESHWIHGGLTYSNPDDPALVVEKLVGVGYTVNMAHPGIRNRLLLVVGFPVFVIWAVLAM